MQDAGIQIVSYRSACQQLPRVEMACSAMFTRLPPIMLRPFVLLTCRNVMACLVSDSPRNPPPLASTLPACILFHLRACAYTRHDEKAPVRSECGSAMVISIETTERQTLRLHNGCEGVATHWS